MSDIETSAPIQPAVISGGEEKAICVNGASFDGIVVSDDRISATVQNNEISVDVVTNTIIKRIAGDYEVYDGNTTFTPSSETQTINTNNKVLLSNIVINPIPQNYGLISWNGATLTVS